MKREREERMLFLKLDVIIYLFLSILTVLLFIPAQTLAQFNDPNEPNNTFTQATFFTIPDTFQVDWDPAGDVDFYMFSGQTGDTVDIQLLRGPNLTWTGISAQLYDTNQSTILREVNETSDVTIQFVLQHSGDYYIKTYQENLNGGPNYDYELRIEHNLPSHFYDPFEPNDNFADATISAITETFYIDWDPYGDEDFFKLTGQEDDTLDIHIHFGNFVWGTGLSMQLYASDTLTQLRNEGGLYDARMQMVLQYSGEYLIKTFQFNGYGGHIYDYTLKINHSRWGYYDPFEPNDNFLNATMFNIPDTFFVEWAPNDDEDYFKFNGQGGDTVNIHIKYILHPGAYFYSGLRIQLWDTDTLTILQDEWGMADATIQFVLQHAGEYYIKTISTSGYGGALFDYELRVTSSAQATDIKTLKKQLQITDYKLGQNYPNPFNPSTTIEFDLPNSSEVSLKIFNVLGEEIATLNWDASEYASGIYLYRLQAGDYVQTRKMVILK
jgi:hypothetical protein